MPATSDTTDVPRSASLLPPLSELVANADPLQGKVQLMQCSACHFLRTISSFEDGRCEELIGEQPRPARRGPAPKLQQQLERLRQLPRAKQKFVVEMLETVLRQAG